MNSALEDRIGQRLPMDSCVLQWFIEHRGDLLNLVGLGADGKVPFQRLRKRKLHHHRIDVGEYIQFMPRDK